MGLPKTKSDPREQFESCRAAIVDSWNESHTNPMASMTFHEQACVAPHGPKQACTCSPIFIVFSHFDSAEKALEFVVKERRRLWGDY